MGSDALKPRIYKPGARSAADSQPDADKAHSGQSGNGTGHPGAEATRDDEPAAKPFPLHCLPPDVEAMAWAICKVERMPESLAGVCTLGILSASIGKGLGVRSGPDRITRANLDLVASAESGSGKSETFRHAARPFHEFEAEAIERWKTSTLPGLEAEKDILEAEIGHLKKEAGKADGADERDEIKTRLEEKKAKLAAVEASFQAPVLSVEDVTTERLAVLLSKRGECLASLSPDAGAIVNNLLGRYSKLDRTDEGIYLKAYSGDYCRIDRMGREPVLLNSPCLAVLWLTQPDKVETLLAERSLTDGGLIPRLLICHTNAEPRPIIEGAAGIPADVRAEYRRLIRELLETYRLASEARTIEPSPEALAAMNAHFNAIVERRRGELRDVTTFAARWNEQAWRIAVCLHAGLHGNKAHEGRLELATARAAIELADWFAGQQLEILSKGRHEARRKIRDEVLSLLADTPAGIRASDIYRARITRNAEEAHSLLAAMETEGDLTGRDEQPEGGGHVTRIYTNQRKAEAKERAEKRSKRP
jgi:hypothetical protein